MNQETALRIAVGRWSILRARISTLQSEIELLNAEKMEIENSTLVSILASQGTRKQILDDGTEIGIDRFVSAKILEGEESDAFDFLDKFGYGSIIKTGLKFQKGEDLADVEKMLGEKGVSYEKEVDVHYKQLDKAVKELVLANEEINPDVKIEDVIPNCINVRIFNKAVIKKAKGS